MSGNKEIVTIMDLLTAAADNNIEVVLRGTRGFMSIVMLDGETKPASKDEYRFDRMYQIPALKNGVMLDTVVSVEMRAMLDRVLRHREEWSKLDPDMKITLP